MDWNIDWGSPGVAGAVSIILTPLIMRLWSAAFPLRGNKEFSHFTYKGLKRRNGWIDLIATVFMLVGMFVPFIFFRQLEKVGLWAVGVPFGLAVIFHFVWVTLVTLPFGLKRFREFWCFYELRWGIGMVGIKVVYIPMGIVGLFSLFVTLNQLAFF